MHRARLPLRAGPVLLERIHSLGEATGRADPDRSLAPAAGHLPSYPPVCLSCGKNPHPGGKHAGLVQRPDGARAAHHGRLLRRLVARCARRDDLHLRHPEPDRALAHLRRPGGRTRHHHPAGLGLRRLAGRGAVRPLGAGAGAAGHHPVVRVLHLPLRLGAELPAIVLVPRPARPRFRRRVGGRRGADGRGDPRQIPRPGGRHRADRLVDRLGRGGAALHPVLLHYAGGLCLAGAVLDRAGAGAAGVLDPALRGGAQPAARHAPGRHRADADFRRAETALSLHHLAGRADGHGCARRQLRADHLAAHLPQDREAHRARWVPAATCSC